MFKESDEGNRIVVWVFYDDDTATIRLTWIHTLTV